MDILATLKENGLFQDCFIYNVLIPYQRAHGLSEGTYITFGAFESDDMILWANKVNEINKNGKIIFHGLSMGGGTILNLSNKEIRNVKGLIVDSPSVSIKNFFQNVSKEVFNDHYEKIANACIKKYKKEFGIDVEDYESCRIISNSKYPILLSAGSNENRDELFERIKHINPKDTDIIILPGCNHGNGMYKQTKLYQNAIKQFIDKYK